MAPVMRSTWRRALQLAIVATAIGLAIAWFAVLDSASHSASDTLRPWLIGVVVIVLAGGGAVLVLERRRPGER